MSMLKARKWEERYFHMNYKLKRRLLIGFSLVVLSLLYAFKNTSFLIRALSTIGLLAFFYLADYLFAPHFHKRHYAFITIIAVTGFLLSPLYFIYPNYDKIQHLILPMMYGSVVFHIVSHLKLELKWKLVFVFFIVLGSLGLFEIGEYWLDYFFDLKLQGVFLRDLQGLEKFDILLDRIDDTMMDMVIGVVGTAVYVMAVYLVRKFRVFRRKNRRRSPRPKI